VLVPVDSHLEIEAMVPNRDVGFVEPGQEAEIKVSICTVLPSVSGRFHRILAVSQTADQALSFMFDADGSTLTRTGVFVSDLCFPHGIDASSDGRFVAITNYGDDTLRIARVQRDYCGEHFAFTMERGSARSIGP
jgi:hypothetical protein